jgi:hypothetical protein
MASLRASIISANRTYFMAETIISASGSKSLSRGEFSVYKITTHGANLPFQQQLSDITSKQPPVSQPQPMFPQPSDFPPQTHIMHTECPHPHRKSLPNAVLSLNYAVVCVGTNDELPGIAVPHGTSPAKVDSRHPLLCAAFSGGRTQLDLGQLSTWRSAKR